jgi:hypothetical protein
MPTTALTIPLSDVRRGDILLDHAGEPILEVADVRPNLWPGYLNVYGTPDGPLHPQFTGRRYNGQRATRVSVLRPAVIIFPEEAK